MKIRISLEDSEFSKLVREKAGGKCEVCGKAATQIHHYFGRGRKSVRFDLNNCLSVCFNPCHRKFHENPEWGREFMIKRLGKDGYEKLNLRANMYSGKIDKNLLMLWIKSERRLLYA